MQFQDRINEISSRTKRLGLTLKDICVLASVDYSTAWRWLTGRTASPRLVTFQVACGALESALDEYEIALAAELIARHGLPEAISEAAA